MPEKTLLAFTDHGEDLAINGSTREEMLAAAEASIKAIGGEDRQALIVAHNDEPHPHVHVILNRVSPTDGRMLGTSNDRLKLSEWALAYRQARGEADKYCPNRAKNIEARKKGEYVRASSETPRSLEAHLSKARAANDNDAAVKERDRLRAQSAELVQRGRDMAAVHKSQWKALSESYQSKKTALLSSARAAKERAVQAVKDQFRPSWVELYRRHGFEAKAFQSREGSLGGKIGNALKAIASRGALDAGSSRGFLSDAFNFIRSRKAREDALAKLHAAEVRKLKAEQNRECRTAAGLALARAQLQLSAQRRSFAAERTALIVRQKADRQEISEAWKARKDQWARAFDRLQREKASRETLNRYRPAGSDRSRSDNFERAADLAGSIKRRRSKERKRDKERDNDERS